jgi:hypothetical protein
VTATAGIVAFTGPDKTCEADTAPNVVENVKSSSEVLVASVFTTAIRYCEPGWTVSAAAKLGELRNTAD